MRYSAVKGEYPQASAVVNTASGPGTLAPSGWERPSRQSEVIRGLWRTQWLSQRPGLHRRTWALSLISALILVQRAEGRLWEVDETLGGRLANDTYGHCISCGAGVPVQRLREALQVAATSRRDHEPTMSPTTRPLFRPTRSKSVSPPLTRCSKASTRAVTAHASYVDRE